MTDAGVNLELIQLSALIGTGLPVVAAIVKQDRFSQRTNTIIAALLAMVAALLATAFRHEFGPQNVAVSFTAIYTTAVAFHHGLWKPTGIAPNVRRRTSPRRPASTTLASTVPASTTPASPVVLPAARWEPARTAPDRRSDLARC